MVRLGTVVVFTILLSLVGGSATACPFCSAIDNTISEDLRKSDATVVARWVDSPFNRAALARPVPKTGRDWEDPLALREFEIFRVYKGQDKLAGVTKIKATFRGRPEPNRVYLIFGFMDQTLGWAAALPMREDAVTYLDALPKLPPPGPERLKFFLAYLDHPEKALADDSYNEFARAPYTQVKQTKPYLDRVKLLAAIESPQTDDRRKRLYFLLLGICGEPTDAPRIWQVMESWTDPKRNGLDAAVACYLTLTGGAGLDRVADKYFRATGVEFRFVYSAIMALRFHGTEEQFIPRAKLCQALHHVLKMPQLADLVIPDLARWEDWTATDEVASLFRSATGENQFVRVPAARYLIQNPTAEAKRCLAELEQVDPEAIRRARVFK